METLVLEDRPTDLIETHEVVEVVEPEAVEPERPEEPEQPAPRGRRGRHGRKADGAEAPEEKHAAEPEAVVAEVVEPEAAEAAEAVEDTDTQPSNAERAPRGLSAWLGALAARGEARRTRAQETRRAEQIAQAHAAAELELATAAASRLPKDHTPEQLRVEIATIREERAVAAQKAEDLAKADAWEAEAGREYQTAGEYRLVYDTSLKTFEQASIIASGAQVQMDTARQGYAEHMGHAVELKRQADELRAQYAESVAA